MGLSLAVAHVDPTGAITLAAGELAVLARSFAGRARLPIELVGGTADYAGATLANSHLVALTADHFRGVRDGSTAGANGNRLWLQFSFLLRHGRGDQLRLQIGLADCFSVSRKWAAVGLACSGCHVRPYAAQKDEEVFISETARP